MEIRERRRFRDRHPVWFIVILLVIVITALAVAALSVHSFPGGRVG